jgi:thioredoxin reductase (NADPH)
LEHEIGYLADFAEKVYLIPMYKNIEIARANITKIMKMPKSIEGNLRANKLVFSEPPSADIPAELPIDGVFMLRESVSPAVLVGGLQVEDGHVVVDRNMATNLAGCYAAGDCTGRPYQYAKAVGEGNVAAHSVSSFLK